MKIFLLEKGYEQKSPIRNGRFNERNEHVIFPQILARNEDRLRVVNDFWKCRAFFPERFFAVFKFVELDFETLTDGTDTGATDLCHN